MAIDLTKSRRTLPSPMLDRSSYSVFSVIKQAIGKDLTRFSIPVIWNEPLSFLQRLAECLEYSSLLDQAASSHDSIERFHLITAFIISSLSTHLERMSKPFNPLLGETFELESVGHAPFHYVAEQVSHHPPISALYVHGMNWILTANIEPKVKFHGTNIVAISEASAKLLYLTSFTFIKHDFREGVFCDLGRWILRISKKSTLSSSLSQASFHSCREEDEQSEVNNDSDRNTEEYTWKTPSAVVHNILFGRIWCEFQGQIDLQLIQSNQRAILTIKSHSWFASQATRLADMFKFSGYIYDRDVRIGAFHGNYGHCYYAIDNLKDTQSKTTSCCSVGGNNCLHMSSNSLITPACDLILTPSSRLIWYRCLPSMTDDELASRFQYYFFTPFTMCLNEQMLSSSLPPTDCRHRQDIRYLEKGALEDAAAEKHRLEEKQRVEARYRENEYQPLWFKKDDKQEYIYTGEYEQRRFDHCPNLFHEVSYL